MRFFVNTMFILQVQGEKTSCRFDWHQTGPNVTISVFSKVADPEKTVIQANRISVNINIVFDGGKSLFEQSIHLKEVRVHSIFF